MNNLESIEATAAMLRLEMHYAIEEFKKNNADKFRSKARLNRAVRNFIDKKFRKRSEEIFLSTLKLMIEP